MSGADLGKRSANSLVLIKVEFVMDFDFNHGIFDNI